MRRSKGLILASVVIGAVAVGLIAGRAQAAANTTTLATTTIYSNLGPGGTYYQLNGTCVSQVLSPGPSCFHLQLDVAMAFTPSANALVSQIDLALTNLTAPNNATIQLAQDSGGLPGAVLRSWLVASQPPFGSCCVLTTVTASPLIPVGAGKQYWVIAKAGPDVGNTTTDSWNYASPLATGLVGLNFGSGWTAQQNTRAAFDVLGCPKLCKVYP